MALCVNADLDYVAVLDKATGREFVLLKQRLGELYKTAGDNKGGKG
jgi:hypothetical protein